MLTVPRTTDDILVRPRRLKSGNGRSNRSVASRKYLSMNVLLQLVSSGSFVEDRSILQASYLYEKSLNNCLINL